MGCGSSVEEEKEITEIGAMEQTPPSRKFTPPQQQQATIKVCTWQLKYGSNVTYPEMSSGKHGVLALNFKKDLGIALSGGGFRAACSSLGWLRGLYLSGTLQKARYISTNSGSSWVNAAMSFNTRVPIETFLGVSLAPGECTLAALRRHAPNSFGKALADASPIKSYVENLIKELFPSKDDQVRAWSEAMGRAFLLPYKLDAMRSLVTCGGTRGNIAAASKVLAQKEGLELLVALNDPIMPYPILLASLILPGQKQEFVPVEFTPLYCGVPPFNPAAADSPVQPLFVEPAGFNSRPVPSSSADASAETLTEVDVQPSFVPLADFAGTSSSYLAQKLTPNTALVADLLGFASFNWWGSPAGKVARHLFGDGGGSDNSAITPLLRRKVRHIIACEATVNWPDDKATWAASAWDISSMFGRYPGPTESQKKAGNNTVAEVLNKMTQVFDSDTFDALFTSIQSKWKAGEPSWHRGSYVVQTNPYLGVEGGWTVEVLWLFNQKTTEWEKQLPEETQHKLKDDRISELDKILDKVDPLEATSFHDFPYISTFAMNYPPELVGLMSQQATWQVEQLNAEILHMFTGDLLSAESVKSRVS